MLHLFQMGPKVLTTFLLYIQNSRQLSLLELPPLLRPCFSWRPHTYQHCDFLGSSSLYTSTVQPRTSGPCSANAAVPHYPPSAHFVYPSSAPSHFSPVLLYLLLPFPPRTRSGFFNGMLGVFQPEALYLASFCGSYLNPGIQPLLVFLFSDPWILCSAM